MFGNFFSSHAEEKDKSPTKATEDKSPTKATEEKSPTKAEEQPTIITSPATEPPSVSATVQQIEKKLSNQSMKEVEEKASEGLQEIAIGDTVHSDTFHKGKAGNVVAIKDGKYVVQFPDAECFVGPEHLKKGMPPLETETAMPEENMSVTPSEATIAAEGVHHIPPHEELPTQTITAKEMGSTAEPPHHTPPHEDVLLAEDRQEGISGHQEVVTGVPKDKLTEAVLSPPVLTTLPEQVVEPAIMTPEPVTQSLPPVSNMTPIQEENTPTAPATPEPSVAATRPLSMEVEPPPPVPVRQQFTGPSAPNVSYSMFGGTGGGNQTSNYAALSTNESDPTHLVANSAASTETMMTGTLRSKFFVTPTIRAYCGNERQRLRDDFNTQEITMELIFTKFDKDKSNYLEKDELRQLLQAHNTAHYINIEDAVKFILTVADENQDGCISKDELRHGLQAWHAFNSMPAEVNRAMKAYGLSPDGSVMPSDEQLRSLLKDLNGFHYPSDEETETVRRTAEAVGATDTRVTTEQMRKALSVWYTNVERKPTSTRTRMEFSFHGWTQNVAVHTRRLIQQLPSTGTTLGIVSVEDLEDPLTGAEDTPKPTIADTDNLSPFSENKCSETIGVILWTMIFILPGMYMHHVAEVHPNEPGCEHDLAQLLKWKGYLACGIGMSGLCYQIVYDGTFRTFCLVSGLLCIVIGLVQEVVGLGYVLFSTPEKCGSTLWNANALFFVWSLFWGPCLGCGCLCLCSGWAFWQDLHSVHEAESDAHGIRSASNGGRPYARE